MDLQRLKQISEAKIKAGILTKEVRDTLKEYKHNKQDLQQGLSETFKPIIKAQEETKQTIDAKQDKLIKQLQENQKAITSGLENIEMSAIQPPQPKQPQQETKLSIGYKPAMMKSSYESNLDKGFNDDEIEIMMEYELIPPSSLLKFIKDGKLTFNDYDYKVGKVLKEIGRQKGVLSRGKGKNKNEAKIDILNMKMEAVKKYRKRIQLIPEGLKTLSGEGLHTQPKRNAYKINQYGQYGGLIIDIPKLMGQLRLIASKDGQKVLDKKVDFDTIDLLTKRFNSKKKYSDIAKMVFNELNQLSEIPIHKTSNKFKKIGSGVVYFNNINDLLDRMELLGGSILAGNNSVKNEFSQIAHKLNQLGTISNKQLIELLKNYVF